MPAPRPGLPRRNVAEDALIASSRMQSFFAVNPVYRTPYGDFPFSVRIGLSFGQVSYWIVHVAQGTAYYFFAGPAIHAAAASEHRAASGAVVFDEAFRSRVPKHESSPIAPGFFLAEPYASVDELPISGGAPPVLKSGIFVAPGVIDVPPQGEFREVASAFFAFENVTNPPALIRQLHELATRYGGTFTGLDAGDKGNNCLIHFGAPVSHENDTERALDFILELRRGLERETRIRAGITKGIRYVGFNGGSRRLEFACLGRATNLAARLMMSAPWGEIYCAPDVVADAQKSYEFRKQSALSFKGFAEPVAASSVVAKKQVSVQKVFHAKELIGRDAELERLGSAIAPIFASPGGQHGRFAGVIYIDGEAGLGKSYLVETYRRLQTSESGQPCLWIQAPCDQTLQSALNPFESAIKEYAGITETSSKEQKRVLLGATLDRLIAHLPERETWLRGELDQARWLFAGWLGMPLPGSPYERLDPRARFARTLSALFAWIRAETFKQPVIFHIEDAHWIDSETRGAIQSIARAAASTTDWPTRLAIVCTARYRDDGALCRFDLDRIVPRTEVALGPLAPDHIGKIAANMMGRPVPEVFLSLLFDNAAGNPFFTEEIVGYWGDPESPALVGEMSLTAPSVALLPSDVNTLLIARLDRLPAPLKNAVFAAAVLGAEFDLRVLTAMVNGRPEDVAEQVRGIEVQRIWLPISPIRYRFRNTLLRNAAYELQARARLQRLHLDAAKAIEAVYAEDLDSHLVELARHYRRAEVNDRARHYLLWAARQAVSRYSHAQAKRHYKAYFKLVGDQPTQESTRVRYEFSRDVYEAHGGLARAWEEYGQMIVEGQRIGSKAAEALGWLGGGRVHWAARKNDDALASLQQALTIARQIGVKETERHALAHMALVYRTMNRTQEALSLFEKALRLGRDLGEETAATPFGEILQRFIVERRVDTALALFEQAMTPAVPGG